MTSPRITFTYNGPDDVIDPWWVRLEQEDIPDDTATLADAADLLNTLYQLDPCNPEEKDETKDPTDEKTAETVEIKVERLACEYDADGNIDVVVQVIRSFQTAPYRLALQGGSLLTTETVRETITISVPVEDSAFITLPYPVIDGFSSRWMGQVYTDKGAIPAPDIRRIGNTLVFEGVTVSSGSISATFITEYDRCTVTITGVNGKPGECIARAFYHGLVEELELKVPEAADVVGSCTTRWGVDPTRYEIECYRDVTISTRCECSEDEVSIRTFDEVVDCPEQVTRCPGNDIKCRHLVGSVTVPEYVSCSDDNEIDGRPGMIYSLSTPEYYEEHCCKKPSFPLPQCPDRTATHKGGVPLRGGARQYYSLYGPKLRITPISPPGGICGNWTIRQQVASSDCCDGVSPLVWDASISPEVMAPNGNAVVAVTGGRGPYTWTVDGVGVQFTFSRSQLYESEGRKALLSGLPTFCGTAEITVTDGCSSVTGYIRSTSGQWVTIYLATGGADGTCPVRFPGACAAGTVGACTDSGLYGRYRITQRSAGGSGISEARMTAAECMAICEQRQSSPPGFDVAAGDQCFDYPGICMTCGDCTSDGALATYYDRANGHHSTIYPSMTYVPGSLRYLYYDIWFRIDSTEIEEWTC